MIPFAEAEKEPAGGETESYVCSTFLARDTFINAARSVELTRRALLWPAGEPKANENRVARPGNPFPPKLPSQHSLQQFSRQGYSTLNVLIVPRLLTWYFCSLQRSSQISPWPLTMTDTRYCFKVARQAARRIMNEIRAWRLLAAIYVCICITEDRLESRLRTSEYVQAGRDKIMYAK